MILFFIILFCNLFCNFISFYFIICISSVLLYNDLHKQYVSSFMQGLYKCESKVTVKTFMMLLKISILSKYFFFETLHSSRYPEKSQLPQNIKQHSYF